MGETNLIERTSRSVGDRGQMRIVAEHWREVFGATDEVEYDLIELPDGTHEVRIRKKA